MGTVEYEEVSEKKTSKLGYLLLTIMVIFIIIAGQTVFRDLRRIPERPDRPTFCVHIVTDANLKDIMHLPAFNVTEIDKKFGLDKKIDKIKPALEEIVDLNVKINDINNQIYLKEEQLKNIRETYGLSLLETIAEEEKALIDKPDIRDSIISLRSDIVSLNQQVRAYGRQRDVKISNIETELVLLRQLYDEAYVYYQDKHDGYELKVFILLILFVLPLFLVSIYLYLKFKRINSPYTIILTAVLTAVSILFIQVVLLALFKVLPAEWLERIFEVFRHVPFLRFIVYYGSVILIIVIFGGIVFYIQKKVFSAKSIVMRRLKNNKCPGCSLELNGMYNICPMCGYKLKEKCSGSISVATSHKSSEVCF